MKNTCLVFRLARKPLICYPCVPGSCSPLPCYIDIPHCASHNWSYLGLFWASLAKQNIWGNKASGAKGRTVSLEMLENYIPVKVLCKPGQKVAAEYVKQTHWKRLLGTKYFDMNSLTHIKSCMLLKLLPVFKSRARSCPSEHFWSARLASL